MQMYRYTQSVGQVYGAGPYGNGTYSGTSTGAGTGTGTNPPLVNTGVAVAGIVTIACVVILVALVVRFWRRPNTNDDDRSDDAV